LGFILQKYHDTRSREFEKNKDKTFQKAHGVSIIAADFSIYSDDGGKYLFRNVETILLKFTT